jgi:uncharacterized membrane protein YdjX (TVP38/TMEM64 family)
MNDLWLTGLLQGHWALAIPLSLLIEVLVAVTGVLPSFFITAANVAVFGLWWGTGLSIVGESLGAVVAFVLSRHGLDRLARGPWRLSTRLDARMQRLSTAPPSRAFALVLAFRLLPFVPSGAVTLAAATSRMRSPAFALASSLGKIPALAVEVATVSAALQLPLKTFLALTAITILTYALFTTRRPRP